MVEKRTDKSQPFRKGSKGPGGAPRGAATRTRKVAGGNRVMMGFSCPTPKANEIDARWQALKLKGRSEYLAALVAADLTAARDGRTLIEP